jgi:hypothetical protein
MRRNSKGQFLKRSSGGSKAVARRTGGGGKRRSSGRARSIARRAGARFRGAMPTITPMRVGKVTAGLLAGTAIRQFIDVPYVSEEALGVLGVAMLSSNAQEKGILADVALALQAKEMLDRFGVTDSIVGFITPGTNAQNVPYGPGAVYDQNGNQVA